MTPRWRKAASTLPDTLRRVGDMILRAERLTLATQLKRQKELIEATKKLVK